MALIDIQTYRIENITLTHNRVSYFQFRMSFLLFSFIYFFFLLFSLSLFLSIYIFSVHFPFLYLLYILFSCSSFWFWFEIFFEIENGREIINPRRNLENQGKMYIKEALFFDIPCMSCPSCLHPHVITCTIRYVFNPRMCISQLLWLRIVG